MNVEEIKILKHIEEMLHIVSKMLDMRRSYKALEKEYLKCQLKYNSVDSEIRRAYPKEYHDYQRYTNSSTYLLNHEMPKGLNSLLLEKNVAKGGLLTLSQQLNVAKTEYENNNLLESYLEKLDENTLNEIIKYLDIDVNIEKLDIDKKSLIKNSIMYDFEVLDEFEMRIPSDELYKGTITIVEFILFEKRICEDTSNKYYKFINEYKDLYENYDAYKKLDEEKGDYYFDKIYTLFNRIFKPKMVEKLFDEVGEIEKISYKLHEQLKAKQKDIEEIIKVNNELFLTYLNHSKKLDELIDRLGESSLIELVSTLDITIPKTEDNYFNEKEEMRTALKNWFIDENAKITMQLEKQTIDNEENQKKLTL